MCLQRLIKAIMQDTGISILTAQSDPKFEASFPLRENAGCPETNGKTLLVRGFSRFYLSLSHGTVVQHNILVEGEQTTQGDGCSLFL